MNEHDRQDPAKLTERIDKLVGDPAQIFPPDEDGLYGLEQYAPQFPEDDEPFQVRNFSNSYGAAVQDMAKDGGSAAGSRPATIIPAFNADLENQHKQEIREHYGPNAVPPDPGRKKPMKKNPRKRRGCGCCGPILGAAVLAVVLAVVLLLGWMAPPKSDASIGDRKDDTATILLCGTDLDGTRTDTMILLYLSGSESRVGMLSIPRDSMVKTSGGNRIKLNAAYGLNGCGEEGMEALLSYVARLTGYRPDGYVLVDMALVPDIVDQMGGVDMDVQQDIDVEGVTISAGQQHLDGEHVLALLRYRKGYANADLGRVAVQRTVVQACMEQWLTPAKLPQLLSAVTQVLDRSTTDLTIGNFAWIGNTILQGMDGIYSDTLPGTAKMVDGVSYYVLSKGDIVEMINDRYNPYDVTITADDLTIVK